MNHPSDIGREVFDIFGVTLAGKVPPIVDHRGRVSLWYPAAGELTFAPTGPVAACDVALVATRKREVEMAHRQIVVSSDRAELIASAMSVLAAARTDGSIPRLTARRLEELLRRVVSDDPSKLPRVADWLRTTRTRDESAVRVAVTDALHPVPLGQGLLVGGLRELRPAAGESSAFEVQFPRAGLRFARVRSGERVTGVITRGADGGVEASFSLLPSSVLLLVAVQQCLVWCELATQPFGLAVGEIARLRTKLLRLRQEVLDDGVDVIDGYRRLISEFGASGWPATADMMPLSQLSAITAMSLRRWVTRRGRARLDRRIDLRRVTDICGYRPTPVGDDEFTLQFGCATLVLADEGDLAVGRGSVLGASSLLERSACAFSAETLEWVAWAAAVRDTPAGAEIDAVKSFLMRALADPWLDMRVDAPPIIAEVEARATKLSRSHAAAELRELLQRRPDNR
jgi:hypothetical protein